MPHAAPYFVDVPQAAPDQKAVKPAAKLGQVGTTNLLLQFSSFSQRQKIAVAYDGVVKCTTAKDLV